MRRRDRVLALVAAALLLSPSPADAQQRQRERRGALRPQTTGAIEGRVTDAETGEPLISASVMVGRTTLGATAGTNGAYLITTVPAGRYNVTASMLGYGAVVKEVEVRAGVTTTVEFELQTNPIEVGGIVVTGTRTPRYVKDVAVRTEVITGRRIEEKGAPNLYEALQGLPGIRIEQRCSACNYSTIRMQGLESGHTQVLIDGQPIYSSLAAVYGLQQITTANIERIEVVKGAGSALYGSSAIAGVINIITKVPTAEPRLEVSSSFGTAGTNAYSMSASRRLGSVDAVMTGQKNTGDEIDEDGDGFTDRVETDNLALGVTLNWYDVFGDDRFSFQGRTLNESRRGGELTTWDNAFAPSAEHIHTNRYEAGFGYRKTFRHANQINLNLTHAFHSRTATNDAFRSDYEAVHGTPPGLDEMQPYVAEEYVYVLDGNYSHPLGKRHHLLAGVQISRNELNETGRYVTVDPADPGYGDTYSSDSEKYANDLAVYLQDDVFIHDALEVVLGARYDAHYSGDEFAGSGKVAPKEKTELRYDERAFSPRIAIRLTASPNLTLRTSVGAGFRVPYGFSEDLHLCSGSPRVYKPVDLKPEESTSFNVAAEYRAQRFTISANLFRTDLRNKIGFTDASEAWKRLGYTYEWRNIAHAYTQGAEVGIRADLGGNLVADLNAAYTDAQYQNERSDWAGSHPQYAEDSKYIPRVPKITGGIGLTYTPDGWDAVLDVNHTGSMYIDYCQEQDMLNPESKIVHTPDFFVVDGRVSRSLGNGMTVFAGVRNLFDYVQKERHIDDPAFIYGPYTGRIVYAGGRVRLY